MEANVAEALRAREIAERRFTEMDYAGAKKYALKAKTLCPGLEGISQMVATFEVYMASGIRHNGEVDYYSVLGLKPSADNDKVKRQYWKMAVLLHPDKNKTVGADGAFKLVSEAWTLLSDSYKRSSYDLKRNKQLANCVVQTNPPSVHGPGVAGYNNYSNPSTMHGLDTFWTVCTSCKVQYEYLRKYVNKRLSCKNCRGTFVAVETGAAPMNGSFPFSTWSNPPATSYASHGHGYDGMTYAPTTSTLYPGNGAQAGHGYEYASNVSFQWSSYPVSSGASGPNGSYSVSNDHVYPVNGNAYGAKSNGKRSITSTVASVNSNPVVNHNGCFLTKSGRPDKRRKLVVGTNFINGSDDKAFRSLPEVGLANGSTIVDSKLSSPSELSSRRISVSMAPAFDTRKMLIGKAKNSIQKKLQDMRLASEAAQLAAALQENVNDQAVGVGGKPGRPGSNASGRQIKAAKTGPVSITVPDPDFHDFDKDRAEECFKPKQIWALYDEDDGMPRLYCLIREVVSTTPFKILITYLNSKTDSEFGSVNWVDSGFTKSCGHFRAYNSDVVDQVNIFSHLLKGEKAGRGGCVRIYPKSGEIWAVYRNWSPDWDRSTLDDVRHRYEMVEVLNNYSEELGLCVAPLVKLSGYKTVYQRDTNNAARRWIPRREMVRFSHQVPSWSLEGEAEAGSMPEKCWDLDPAATPDELLHSETGSEALA